MNYADIKRVDVANGEGVRVSVFVSGCNHHCKGCFNQCAWDFNYGNKFTEKEMDKVINYLDHDYISGLSLLGGEPLEKQNQEGLLPLVKKVKEKFPDKNIWCYTGFDFEKDVVGKMAKENETTKELLKQLPIEMEMQELNGNEKYYYLNQNLPTNASKVHTIKEGDIMLYGKNCLVFFYENFDTNYQYTPIGYVEEVSGFSQALGKGTVKVVLKIAEDSAS